MEGVDMYACVYALQIAISKLYYDLIKKYMQAK